MKIILLLCAFTIVTLLTLQYVWIKDYYNNVKSNFQKEVNLAIEDAVKKESMVHLDTIEQLITEELMDTTEYRFTSKFNKKDGTYSYTIHGNVYKNDMGNFSSSQLNDSIRQGDLQFRRKIAVIYAKIIRDEDLSNHFLFYRTQRLGKFVDSVLKKYNFDTTRLRPIAKHYLDSKDLNTSFIFHLANADSTSNILPQNFPNQKDFPIITKAFPTYKWGTDKDQYVRAQFPNPIGYVLSKTKWILLSALLLLISVFTVLYLLYNALKKEKRLAQIKDDFIHNMNHELKTPIAVLSASIEAMTDFDILDDKAKAIRYLQYSKDSVEQLENLSKRVLDSSLLEEQQYQLSKENILVSPILETLKNSFFISSQKNVSIEIECESSAKIYADKILFMEVLSNIMDNAIKYSDNEVDIHIQVLQIENYKKIFISDNGWGIEQNDLAFIFEKFFRGKSPYHAVKGHGLGLNIVSNIMHAHHGTIVVKSKKGKGTNVELSWPI